MAEGSTGNANPAPITRSARRNSRLANLTRSERREYERLRGMGRRNVRMNEISTRRA